MEKKDILQFEADDASEMGINGKQVFFTKRINGKTTHNKISNENINEDLGVEEKNENNEDNELYVEFKTPKFQEQKEPKKKKTTVKKKLNKNKRRKDKKRKIVKAIVLLILIAGIAIFAMMSPIFNIEKIEVSGNEKIEKETIISLSNVYEGSNIFRISKKDIKNNLKENTYINSVNVKRKLPGTLEIAVEERKIAYQIKVIDSFVYIDYQGYILEKSSKIANVPVLEGLSTEQDTLLNKKRVSNKDIELLNTVLRIRDASKIAEVSDLISKITISKGEFTLELSSENKIVCLGDGTEITNKMMYLKAIINKEKGHKGKIFLNGDLNSGFKPYFREEQQSSENIKKSKESNDKEKN